MKKCNYAHNAGLLILRLLLGGLFIYHVLPKLGAPAGMVNFIGGVPGSLGLTFLSTQTWFWLAVVGEITVAVTALLGLWTRAWMVVLWIIMFFAMTTKDWGMPAIELDLVLAVIGIVLFVAGPGKYSLDKEAKKASANKK